MLSTLVKRAPGGHRTARDSETCLLTFYHVYCLGTQCREKLGTLCSGILATLPIYLSLAAPMNKDDE